MMFRVTILAVTILTAGPSHAAGSQYSSADLGAALTPWGAEVAGNAAGTIPQFTGGLPISTSPAGFVADSGKWADPYADDQPLFVITAANMDEYAEQLSESTQELLRRFPDSYSVTVYPSRRSANYPDWVNENSLTNAQRCKLIENGLAVQGCFGGIPFPVPQNGHEVVWNALLSYSGVSNVLKGQGWYVDAKGSRVMTAGIDANQDNQYYNQALDVESFETIGTYLSQLNVYTAPARNVGEANLLQYYVNPVATPNPTWTYSPGQRRVRRSPDAQYDFPVATSGGVMLYDEIALFSGKQDRFDFTYLGKKEMIIPYNNYRWMNTAADDLLTENHPNPDVMRWELHRVHVVELTLKDGMRHVQPKRRLYYNEDILGAGMSDAWDAAGQLTKGNFKPSWQMYDKQIPHAAVTWMYNFATGVYYHNSILGGPQDGVFIRDEPRPVRFFTAESLGRQSQR